MNLKKNISRDDIADAINREFGFARKECLDIVNDIIEIIIETILIQIVVVKPLNKNFKLVNPSILFGDKINQFNSLLPHEVNGKIKSKKNKFLTLQVIKN